MDFQTFIFISSVPKNLALPGINSTAVCPVRKGCLRIRFGPRAKCCKPDSVSTFYRKLKKSSQKKRTICWSSAKVGNQHFRILVNQPMKLAPWPFTFLTAEYYSCFRQHFLLLTFIQGHFSQVLMCYIDHFFGTGQFYTYHKSDQSFSTRNSCISVRWRGKIKC